MIRLPVPETFQAREEMTLVGAAGEERNDLISGLFV
jgi:hypothetical protein